MPRQQPIPFRPASQDNRSWLEAYAKETGRSRNSLLEEALADLRAKHGEGYTQAPESCRRPPGEPEGAEEIMAHLRPRLRGKEQQ